MCVPVGDSYSGVCSLFCGMEVYESLYVCVRGCVCVCVCMRACVRV